jgi:hypothetical protein
VVRAMDGGDVATRAGGTPSPWRAATAHQRKVGHHRANVGSWLAVALIIIGAALGAFALVTHSEALWITTGVALIVGGLLALGSGIMEQAY